MHKNTFWIVLSCFLLALVACQPMTTTTAGTDALQQRLDALEARLDAIEPASEISELEARIAALEETITALQTTQMHSAEKMPESTPAMSEMHTSHDSNRQLQVFQVTVTTYLLDTAGLHALDERLNEEGLIEPADAGKIRRIQRLVAMTDWPEGLEAKAAQLSELLVNLAKALANDDLTAAQPLASQVHEVQHDLSHIVEMWLAGQQGTATHDESDADHQHSAAHLDHSGHHGGIVSMYGDLHVEIVATKAGEYRVYLTDAFRKPIDLAGISGGLTLMPDTEKAVSLPFEVVDGEYLVAEGDPTDMEVIDVRIRLDGTPEGPVEMDFTLPLADSHEGDAEHSHDHGS